MKRTAILLLVLCSCILGGQVLATERVVVGEMFTNWS